jgi:hypothetical protein
MKSKTISRGGEDENICLENIWQELDEEKTTYRGD